MSAILNLRSNNGNGAISESSRKSSIGIRGRLFLGFSVVIFVFLIGIVITLLGIENAKKYSSNVINKDIPIYDASLDLNSLIYEAQLVTQKAFILPDINANNQFLTIWTQIENYEATIDNLSVNSEDNIYFRNWNEIKQLLASLKMGQAKVFALLNTDKNQALQVLNTDIIPTLKKLNAKFNLTLLTTGGENGLLDKISKNLHQGASDVMISLTMLQSIEYLIFIIGVLIAIIISFYTAKNIVRHINIFRAHSSRVASGDLTQYIGVESKDEMGQLGHDINVMTESLAAMIREITQASHNMVTTLEEVQHTVDIQSAGASEQASSINEITASLSEIEKSSAQTMEKAKSLGKAAEQTREKGQLGLESVNQSVNGMNEVREKVQLIAQTILDLSHKTQQVGEITGVVNNLAQQSKMLALNASIEAAKAGEFGKGFAIVANEVKTLAEQSEQATTQVQKILEDIRQSAEKAVMVTEEGTKGVDKGTVLVEQTGELIRNLNDVIHETTIATQQIASAVRQENAGIEQITTGMNEINQVTSSFVESVKQTIEAMNNLANISKNLKVLIDTYKL